MRNYIETGVLVCEIKGLLKGVEDRVRDARFNIAVDNVQKLPEDLNYLRGLINAMEEKINEYSNEIKKDEENDEFI